VPFSLNEHQHSAAIARLASKPLGAEYDGRLRSATPRGFETVESVCDTYTKSTAAKQRFEIK
jgi:hypothetical protein